MNFQPERIDPGQPGIWRYRYSFGFREEILPVSLGEGQTPLVWAEACGRRVAFKCEYLNPTGSFKDRGSTVLASCMLARNAHEIVEDSSGNAGASLAAYAARAGLRARIFVPAAASGPKRQQIVAYGAELVPIAGSRTDVSTAILEQADQGAAYASHAYLPFNLTGYATAAYEIYEQLGALPGTLIVPAGQGGLLLGLARGFEALRIAYHLESGPRFLGVQARACAPLWAFQAGGQAEYDRVAENPTLAEGVKVRFPVRLKAVVQAIQASRGKLLAIEEAAILPGREALARLGLYVEPTSALVWPALQQLGAEFPDPVVVVLTGSGYKYR